MTIADEITHYETRLTNIRAKIDKIESYRAIEEGSQGGRFRTEFANINDLYKQESTIKTKLMTLKASIL
jgi:hypothetical protein